MTSDSGRCGTGRRRFLVGVFGRELDASPGRCAHVGRGRDGGPRRRLPRLLLDDARERGGRALVRRAVGRRRLLLVVGIGRGRDRGARWECRRCGLCCCCRRGATLEQLDVVGGREAVAAVLADERPVRVGDVVDVERGVLLEGQLLVRLAGVVVEGLGLRDRRRLLDVVVGDEALGLLLLLAVPLLLRFPPIVVGRLLQHHQHIALTECELAVALGHVVEDGAVDAEEHHCAGYSCRV
jgi:hypothetical protein